MAHRILEPDGHDPDAPTVIHDATTPMWTAPRPGSYDPAGSGGLHRHDDERAGFHAEGDRPHYHDPASGIVVFFDPDAVQQYQDDRDREYMAEAKRRVAEMQQHLAATVPLGADQTADPTPVAVPDGAATSPEPSGATGGDAAGAGRPPRPRDGKGRFLPNGQPDRDPTTELARVPVSVALEHALIDADANLFLYEQHQKLAMARVLVAAIAFGAECERTETAAGVYASQLVRLGNAGGDGS